MRLHSWMAALLHGHVCQHDGTAPRLLFFRSTERSLNRLVEDVCVVGGGPAGAIISRRLAQLGHRVCLIERRSVSRRPASETLSSSIRGLLEQLGLWERIEHLGFLQCDRMQVRWRDEATLQGNDALIVDRPRFDRTLREAAAQAGATVLCPARARRPARLGERWVIPID